MDDRSKILRDMKICRFCLSTEENELSSICQKSSKDPKQSVPLPVQIMACMAIEVFPNDGMPQLICNNCRQQTVRSYIFKTNCKRAEDALRLFLYTGTMNEPVLDPVPNKNASEPIPLREFKINKDASNENPKRQVIEIEDGSEIITLSIGGIEKVEENETEKIVYLDEDMQDTISENDDTQDEGVQQVETECFPCPHCDRTFPLEQLLDIHVTNHDRERLFHCDRCDKRFFSKYDLTKHQVTHGEEKPFKCVVCERTFSREALLRRHESVHNNAPKYLCPRCDRTYLSKLDLNTHMQKHQKKRPFTCTMCEKSFVFKQGLERHMSTHSQDKPHKCNYCEASFNTPIRLARHVTTHAGLRPYPCKICSRTFLLSHHLTRHMRTHYASRQGRNPEETIGQHKCDICSMSFKRKDSLVNHSAIHSMVNLVCVICDTSFETAQMVKEHITSHLQDLPFPCEKCDYSFETSDQLEEHELKHAEMEYEEQIEQEFISETSRHASGYDDVEDEENEVTEYTITNIDNLEVMPKSQAKNQEQQRKLTPEHSDQEMDEDEVDETFYKRENSRNPQDQKYIEQFFKTENDSEVEEETAQKESPVDELVQEEALRPIVRSEGTKVYKRKGPIDRKIPVVLNTSNQAAPLTAPLEEITDLTAPITNMKLPQDFLSSMPKKSQTNVKVGDKVVKVQKFIMTKDEIKNLAKQGIIELKNGKVVLKNSGQSIINASLKPVEKKDIDNLIQQQIPRARLKQYQRKISEADGTENIDGLE